MFLDNSAYSMSGHMLISHFELHILPKVSKTVVIISKTQKNVFGVKILTQRIAIADIGEINRAKT